MPAHNPLEPEQGSTGGSALSGRLSHTKSSDAVRQFYIPRRVEKRTVARNSTIGHPCAVAKLQADTVKLDTRPREGRWTWLLDEEWKSDPRATKRSCDTGNHTAFVYLEDDTEVGWDNMLSWAIDAPALEDMGFSRGFWRTEVDEDGEEIMLDMQGKWNMTGVRTTRTGSVVLAQ